MTEEELNKLVEQQIANNEEQASATVNELLRKLHPEYADYIDLGYVKAVCRMNDDARAELRVALERDYG